MRRKTIHRLLYCRGDAYYSINQSAITRVHTTDSHVSGTYTAVAPINKQILGLENCFCQEFSAVENVSINVDISFEKY